MKKTVEQVWAVLRAAWTILTYPLWILWWEAKRWYLFKVRLPRMLAETDRLEKEWQKKLREEAEKKE